MGSRVRQEAGMPHLQGTTQISNGRSWPWLLITISLAGCSSTPGVVGSTGSVSGYAVTDVSSTTMPPYTDEELQAAARVRQKPRDSVPTPLFEAGSGQDIFGSPQATTAKEDRAAQEAVVSAEETGQSFTISKGSIPGLVEAPFDAGGLAARLESLASKADDPVPAQFARALMPLIGYPMGSGLLKVDDFEHRTDLTEAERQLLHETASFSSRASTRLANGEPARQVLEDELTRLLEAIRDPEPFSITFATLINEVRGLGDFSPRRSNKFIKGANHDVRLYMDFEGVHWGFDGTNFSTELEIQIQVMKSDGYRVFSTGWESMRDSRARRVGVFAWTSFTLADDLEIGTYAIKIRVRQPETSNLAEHLLPFEIVSRLAQGG